MTIVLLNEKSALIISVWAHACMRTHLELEAGLGNAVLEALRPVCGGVRGGVLQQLAVIIAVQQLECVARQHAAGGANLARCEA